MVSYSRVFILYKFKIFHGTVLTEPADRPKIRF